MINSATLAKSNSQRFAAWIPVSFVSLKNAKPKLPSVSLQVVLKVPSINFFHFTIAELMDGSRFDGRMVDIDYF